MKPSRDVEIKSEDSLREYSSDEGPSRRRRQEGSRNEDEPEDEDEQEIELPPSIESSRESSSSSQHGSGSFFNISWYHNFNSHEPIIY